MIRKIHAFAALTILATLSSVASAQMATATVRGDTIWINGTAQSDFVSVRVSENDNRRLIVKRSTTDAGMAIVDGVNTINQIIFFGRDGNDTFQLNQDLAINCDLYGGPGMDNLFSARGDDYIAPGNGEREGRLISGPGSDRFDVAYNWVLIPGLGIRLPVRAQFQEWDFEPGRDTVRQWYEFEPLNFFFNR